MNKMKMVISGKKLTQTKILQKYWMDLYLEDHQIGGEKTFEFLVVQAPNWAMSIPETEDGKYLLVKQYRPAWEMISIEFPAGRVNEGEAMDETVARELREETGYSATKHELVLKLRQSTSNKQNVGIYRSSGLTFVGQDLDEQENIAVITASKEEIQAYIDNGKMVQMASILAFQFIK